MNFHQENIPVSLEEIFVINLNINNSLDLIKVRDSFPWCK